MQEIGSDLNIFWLAINEDLQVNVKASGCMGSSVSVDKMNSHGASVDTANSHSAFVHTVKNEKTCVDIVKSHSASVHTVK
jgi:hypothetical protein